MSSTPASREDPWRSLRRWTSARIALGRAGGSLPTRELLRFRWDHARAVDAVEQRFDAEDFARRLNVGGCLRQATATMCLHTAATDHRMFLLRPDLGRRLSDESRQKLQTYAATASGFDLAIIVSEGLSALAVERQAPALLEHLLPMLDKDWKLAPLIVVHRGRVALQDEIGGILGAPLALVLIGERPGLNSPDSLGAYLVYDPKPGNTDADRNCVSNIRPEGLPPVIAARKIHYLLSEARRRRISGVALKDESDLSLGAAARTPLEPGGT